MATLAPASRDEHEPAVIGCPRWMQVIHLRVGETVRVAAEIEFVDVDDAAVGDGDAAGPALVVRPQIGAPVEKPHGTPERPAGEADVLHADAGPVAGVERNRERFENL